MTFQKQFTYQFLGSLTDFIVSLTLAILFHNVWALVAGMIANSAMRFMLSYLLSNYRPQFEINFKLFKGMNQYGKWIFGSNILQFMYSQGDDILVGRLLGTVSLGYYQLAYRISNLPTTQITWLISTVMFPVYSKIQNDRERIAKIYPSVLQIITYLSFFIGALIILFANDFTVLFLGDKWLPIVPAMQILTIWGIIRSIGATTGPVWQALGTPKIVTQIQMTQVIILILIVYPLTVTYNIVGTAIAVVLSSLISIIIAIILIIKTLKLRSNNFFEDLIYPLLSSICMALIYYLFKLNIFFNINFLNFVTLSLICIIAYLLTTIILSKFLNYRIYKNLFMIIRNMNMPIAINNKLSWLESIIT